MTPNYLLFFILFAFANIVTAQVPSLDWYSSWGNMNSSRIEEITVDRSLNIYVTGIYDGTIDLDPGPLTYNIVSNGVGDIPIIKYSPAGNVLWAKTIGGSFLDQSSALTTDNDNNCIIAGQIKNTVDIDPNTPVQLVNVSNLGGMVVLKLDSNGNTNWSFAINCTLGIYPESISSDSNDDIYITGNFSGTFDADPGAGVTSLSGNSDIFMLKYSSSGNLIWAKKMGGSFTDKGFSIILDNQDNVILTGVFMDTVDFNPGIGTNNLIAYQDPNNPSLYEDAFLAKYTSNGNYIWAKQIAMGGHWQRAFSTCIDSEGNLLNSGFFFETCDFDPGVGIYNLTATQNSPADGFIQKLDSAGNFLWAFGLGGIGGDIVFDITTDRYDDVHIVGTFSGTVDFNPDTVFNMVSSLQNTTDMFLASYTSSGQFVNVSTFSSNSIDEVRSVLAINNKLLIAGAFQGPIDVDPQSGQVIVTPNSPSDAILIQLDNLDCNRRSIRSNYVSNIGCNQPGQISIDLLYGTPPFSYTSTPSLLNNSDTLLVYSQGIYTITVMDSDSCTDQISYLINAPTTSDSIDFRVNAVTSILQSGDTSLLWIDANNDGCVASSGQLVLEIDTLIQLIDVIPVPFQTTGNQLIWNLPLMNYDSSSFQIALRYLADTMLMSGDTIVFSANVLPVIGDVNTANNTITLNCILQPLNPLQPSQRILAFPGRCLDNFIDTDQEITYSVYFTNNTASSIDNFLIIDTLSQYLDLTTLRVLSSNKYVYSEVVFPNTLIFHFDDVGLLNQTQSHNSSSGYIHWTVSPNTTFTSGDVLTNIIDVDFGSNFQQTNFISQTGRYPLPDTSVLVSGNVITAVDTSLFYSWLDCSQNLVIPNQNSYNFSVTYPGNFAMIVSDGCYSDTSSCYFFLTTDFLTNYLSDAFQCYPNPANDFIDVNSPEAGELIISNSLGQIVDKYDMDGQSSIKINVSNFSSGVYYISNPKGRIIKLIVI